MKILLTGADGQLGRALRSQSTPHLIKAFSRQSLDITNAADVEAVMATEKPDAVINAAAYNHVDQAENDAANAYAINQKGPENLAMATARRKIPLIHVSTDYVFDGKSCRPYVESDSPHPLSVYAMSKRAGEKAVLSFHPQAAVVRTAWVFHAGGKNFLLTILGLKHKPVLSIVNDQFGSPTFAPHLARALLALAEKPGAGGVYHASGSGQATWFDLAKHFFGLLMINTPIQPISAKNYPYKAPRPRYTVLGTQRKDLPSLPPWEQGLEAFVNELKSEPTYGL